MQKGLGELKELHSNLGKIKSIWVNFNNLNQIQWIETDSFKFGYNWEHLSKLEEVNSDLGILFTFG